MITNDTEKQKKSPSGGIRNNAGKVNFLLIPGIFTRRLAKWFTDGAEKYSRGNWKKGQPLHWYIESLYRHLDKLIAGDESEDHLAAIAWNVAAFMWTQNELREGNLPEYLHTIGSDAKCDPDTFELWYKEWELTGISFNTWKNPLNFVSKFLYEIE